MPFGYSREIFKYPPVQYIPLDRYNEITGNISRLGTKVRIYIYRPVEEDKLRDRLNQLGIEESYNIDNNTLGILVINGRVDLIQYRGYEVIMVGNPEPQNYHLFAVTDRYFYKDDLVFTFYNGATSQRLALRRHELR